MITSNLFFKELAFLTTNQIKKKTGSKCHNIGVTSILPEIKDRTLLKIHTIPVKNLRQKFNITSCGLEVN